MDRGAVVALLVVLGDDLPVGGQLVGVPVHHHQVLGPIRRDDVLPTRYVLGEFGVLAAGVDEQPAVPVLQAQFCQPELVGLETLDVFEVRRIA